MTPQVVDQNSAALAASFPQPVAFETPSSRADEFGGAPGVIRFLALPARPFVMVDGEGAAGEAAFAPLMPGLTPRPTVSDLHSTHAASRSGSGHSRGCGGPSMARRIWTRSSVWAIDRIGDGR